MYIFSDFRIAAVARTGPDSCSRHLAWARGAGVAARVLRREGIGLDVDAAEDLAELMAALAPGGGSCARLLCDSELGRRVGAAIAAA